MPLISFILPTIIPVYFWGETWTNAWYIAAIARYTWSLNVTWCINSFAHIVGMKPFDKHITPTDHPITALFTVGEGWHNYHHVFPWFVYSCMKIGIFYNFFVIGITKHQSWEPMLSTGRMLSSISLQKLVS
jgi:stearoyl-CoA desaturase (delta-9 desaturase)